MTEPGSNIAIEMEDVTKRFGRVTVLPSVSLQIFEGEFFSMLGPSGCGKTTSLRIIGGFEEPDSGRILLRGKDVTRVPPNKRNVNLVFQNYELFPHMNVYDNVAYSLKIRGIPRPEIADRVGAMLALVGVSGLEGRGVRELSGGQQQRIALARALINRPFALLLDEPLSALDVKLRKRMQTELKAIQAELRTTFVYVTHDQEEALQLSDRIAVMHEGVIRQVGPPQELYRHPSDAFVADFVGSMNVWRFEVGRIEEGIASMDVTGGRAVMQAPDGASVGSVLNLAIRPERITMQVGRVQEPIAALGHLIGRVADTVYLGETVRYSVDTGLGPVTVVRLDDSVAHFGRGAEVTLTWDPGAPFALAFNGVAAT